MKSPHTYPLFIRNSALTLLFALLILCPFLGSAQNYNCFELNVRHYFTNDIFYLRGIELDSVIVSGADTIYFPFKTQRSCTSCDYGSWLGGKVIKNADGAFLFNTINDDTVIIRPQASPGDSWTFYNDASANHYGAEVVSVDTMTVLGTLDSVKRFRLTAYNLGVVNTSNPLHNRDFYISQHHGFVKIFDLYNFPYYTASYDLYLDHVGTGTFTISDYHPPTKLEIFDFNPGDAFYTVQSSLTSSSHIVSYTFDSITSKSVINSYRTEFTFHRWVHRSETYYHGSSGTTVYHYYSSFDGLQIADTALLMPTTMPESLPEFLMDYFYNPNDSNFCVAGKRYTAEKYIPFEGCDQGYTYKTGFERCAHINNTPLIFEWPGCDYESSNLRFSIKNGISCGAYPGHPNAVTQIETPPVFELFPNPATDMLTVNARENITSIVIRDMQGRILFSGSYDAKHVEIDISTLPKGLYMAQINNYKMQKIVKL